MPVKKGSTLNEIHLNNNIGPDNVLSTGIDTGLVAKRTACSSSALFTNEMINWKPWELDLAMDSFLRKQPQVSSLASSSMRQALVNPLPHFFDVEDASGKNGISVCCLLCPA